MPPLWQQLIGGVTLRETLVAIADLVIVYYIAYRLLLLIRGTRAAQMAIGVFLIVGALFVAKQFELTTVSWLFDRFVGYFIIVIIVVFQEDIRRALMRMGMIFSGGGGHEDTFVLEEVIKAATHMARAHIGGLIVLEREADLGEFVNPGVELDARVSQELLVSLFIPDAHNACHDGAVIIKNRRVQQAGALLPLSNSTKLDKQLGTRHRAAIGISEETDAVVVVVSEERGQVSLCFHGNIARDLSEATLRKALLGLYQKRPRRSRMKPRRGGRPESGQGSDPEKEPQGRNGATSQGSQPDSDSSGQGAASSGAERAPEVARAEPGSAMSSDRRSRQGEG